MPALWQTNTGTNGDARFVLCGTRRHSRTKLPNLVQLADAGATTELTELIPSRPALRPADIYTVAALPGTRAALDIGICPPDAVGAGSDCCEAMWQRKTERYAEHFEELALQGIRYVPMIVSCYGRLHREAENTMERIALQAGRRQGVSNYRPLLRRTQAALGATVVSRAVAMARACLPKLRQDALQLLFAEGLDGEETAGGSGGDGTACEDWTGDTGGRGGELSVRDGSLARSGRLSGLWHTSRPPPTIG